MARTGAQTFIVVIIRFKRDFRESATAIKNSGRNCFRKSTVSWNIVQIIAVGFHEARRRATTICESLPAIDRRAQRVRCPNKRAKINCERPAARLPNKFQGIS